MGKPPSSDTSPTLLWRVKNPDDAQAWSVFFNKYQPLIYQQARRSGLSESEAEDVTQETLIELSRRIMTFTYTETGSFRGWLSKLTSWRIANMFRTRSGNVVSLDSLSSDASEEAQAKASVDAFASQWEAEARDDILGAALDRLRVRLPVREFQVLQLLVIRRRAPAEIARSLGITLPHVYVMKSRALAALRKELRRVKFGR